MKRLIPALVLLVAPAAFADGLSKQVGVEAARLLVQVNAVRDAASAKPMLKPAPLTSALITDLQRFGLSASRLSIEIDQRGGPVDLRCIFRGMAEETDKQLITASAATTGAQQAGALSRLSYMLSDAVEIAPAADAPTQTKTAAKQTSAAASSCPVVRDLEKLRLN